MQSTIRRYYKIFFLLFFGLISCLAFVIRNYQSDYAYLGGDEPNYIMMTESLLLDTDFNLKNDYELDRPLKYYPERLFPQLAPIIDYEKSENWQSIHTVGLPLLLALPYSLAGVQGARFFMMGLQLLSVVLFYYVLKKFLTNDIKIAFGLAFIMTSSIFWQNFGAIFPDFLVVNAVLIAVLVFASSRFWANLIFVSAMIIGYVAHTKIALFLIPLFIAHHILLLRKMGIKLWFAKLGIFPVTALICAAAYSFFLYKSYGIISPSQIYGKQGQLFSANPFTAILAISTDRTKGLLIYMPGLVLAVTYGFFALKDLLVYFKQLNMKQKISKQFMLLVGLIIGFTLFMLTQLTFNDWSGSYAPNGRYFLILIFSGAYIFARYIDLEDRLQVTIGSVILVIDLIISTPFLTRFHIFMDPGISTFLTRKFGILSLAPSFPPLVNLTPGSELIKSLLVFGATLLVSFSLYCVYRGRRRQWT